jgi:hypothetical protein
VNRAKAKRWLNEYLDGEIGLADKGEFERMMAQDPELRQEYEALRKIGLLMSSGPEIEVNPTSFRARLMERIEPQQRYNFTPQRAFAGSMLVALLVVGLSFGQYIYGQVMNRNAKPAGTAVAGLTSESSVHVNASAAQFLNATLLRAETGRNPEAARLVELLDQQTGLYDGATCSEGPAGHVYVFPRGLPNEISIRVEPSSLHELEAIIGQLAGRNSTPTVVQMDGSQLSLTEYSLLNPHGKFGLHITFSK